MYISDFPIHRRLIRRNFPIQTYVFSRKYIHRIGIFVQRMDEELSKSCLKIYLADLKFNLY
jgi:hypothetical protein